MINKDYILRLAERLGRELSIILGLRQRQSAEEALIYLDDLLLRNTGFTSRFLNALSEEALRQMLSPLGRLNVDAALWTAALLHAEGLTYEEMGQADESYYRYTKSLFLLIEALKYEPIEEHPQFSSMIHTLQGKLSDYQLPLPLRHQLFWYHEHKGQYALAETLLFELLEDTPDRAQLCIEGKAFYQRLLKEGDATLQAGNIAREEIYEGLRELTTFDTARNTMQ